jgi:hypothetical protein
VTLTQIISQKAICPSCRAEIPSADVNVTTDLALCRRCGKISSFVEAMATPSTPVDLSRPPKGTWLTRHGNGFELGASTRHPIAFFLVPFACVWSGGSLGGIYGTQISKGQFNLFMSLFGLPFLIGSIFLVGFTLMTLCGKILLRVEGSRGVLFTGIGPIGFRQHFNWSDVSNIRLSQKMGRNSTSTQITIDAGKELSFASGIKSERLAFLLAALHEMQKEYKF